MLTIIVIACTIFAAHGATIPHIPTTISHTPPLNLTKYHNYDEMKNYMLGVAAMNPSFVQVRELGTTYEGRKLIGLKIGYPAQATNKRAVWLDGGNHAREWPAFHTTLYFIDQLVKNYGVEERITNYVNKLNIYVFPLLNPDGLEYSLTSQDPIIRHWRKNRAHENCTGRLGKRTTICCVGVDLNRNYDFAFKDDAIPFDNPCSDEFQGPFPFSEPETRAVRDFVMSQEVYGKLDALVSLHTHGQYFVLPYNNKRGSYPADIEDLRALAQKAVDRIQAHKGTKYKMGTAADILGPASGGATDWIKKNTPTKYVYVIELPPRLTSWFAFQVKPHWLLPTAQETWLGVQVIIDQVLIDSNQEIVN